MSARELGRTLSSPAGLGLALALGLLPLVHLVHVALTAPPAATPDAAWSLDARTQGLLGRSLGIALAATVGALALGTPIALILARMRFSGCALLTFTLLAAFAVSPYWLALGWLRGDLASPMAERLLGHTGAVVLVLATAHAASVALLGLVAARSLPVGWEEAALLAAPPGRVLWRILLPQMRPLLGVAALLVFSLCFADYEVASLLQVVTYPVEVFLLYSSVFAPGEAARACLPLLAIALVTASGLGTLLSHGLTRQWPSRVAGPWQLSHRQRVVSLSAALSVVFVTTLWPAQGLVSQLGRPGEIGAALLAGAPALGNSLATTAGSVLLALALGTAASGALVRTSRPARTVLVTGLLLPVCLPGPVYGIAWVELASTLPASLRAAIGSVPPLVPALCLAARWAGLVAILVASARLALPSHALDAARLAEGRAARRFWRIELAWIAPVAIGAAALVCALSQSAVGVLVLTVPPGFEVAPLRIDNLLHYGAREQAVALAVCAAGLAAALPLALTIAARRSGRRLS